MYVPQSLWPKVGNYIWSELKQNNFSLGSRSLVIKYKSHSTNMSELLSFFTLQFVCSSPVIDAAVCLKLAATTYGISACERSL
jgi:hypothetical protein